MSDVEGEGRGKMVRIAATILLTFGMAGVGLASDGRFNEAPILEARVLNGSLPPVSDRLSAEPVVVTPVEELGRYGGTWRRVHMGTPRDAGPESQKD